MLLRLLLLFAIGASALHAARPWPVFKRSYISALAGPAVEFEVSATGRWRGTPGETVPGTSWSVQAIRFMPAGVFLVDREKRVACALAVNRSPWYEPHARVVTLPELARPAATRPEAPPAPRTAAWYAELAREYAFVGRSAESNMVQDRALALRRTGDLSEPQAPTLIEKPPDASALTAARREDVIAQEVLERIRARRDVRKRSDKSADGDGRDGASEEAQGDPAATGTVTAGLADPGAPRTAPTSDRGAGQLGAADQPGSAGALAAGGAAGASAGGPGAPGGPPGAAAGAAGAAVTAGAPSAGEGTGAVTSSTGPAPSGATGPVSTVSVAEAGPSSGPSGGTGPVAGGPVATATSSSGPVGPSVSSGPVAMAPASSGPIGPSVSAGPVAVAAASSGPSGGTFSTASFGGGGGGGGMRGST